MHNALTFCRMFHTHTKSTSICIDATHIPVTGPRPPTDPCWRIQHTRWSIENSWQLSLAFEWNRAPCRVSHPAFLISMLHTHPHTRTHWRPRTNASCRDSLRFWLRLQLRLCDMKYSCNRRHQNVCLQRAFNCISSARREESKSKSKYFRYVFGCAPSRHDIAILFFFPSLFFSAFKQAAGKQFFSALWSAIRAAHAVRVKRAVNIARHRLLNALESWKKKKKKKMGNKCCKLQPERGRTKNATCTMLPQLRLATGTAAWAKYAWLTLQHSLSSLHEE